MRLLNTTTYEVRDFPDDQVKFRYAILSHTWDEEGEVTFADIQDSKRVHRHRGWPKVRMFCDVARSQKFEWVWDDTCCIDKNSSSELSEAINSMYNWYANAAVCYAYLQDVTSDKDDPFDAESSFRHSRWFKRGWTLQELIAPRTLVFYSSSWRVIGTRRSLAPLIEEITRIDRTILVHTTFLEDVSVARRMSWAAERHTSRPEDHAYSLMGIFGVHMPAIYGEGDLKAFVRLQLEIIQQSPDHSIFAWGQSMLDPTTFQHNVTSKTFFEGETWASEFRSLLASSPKDFEYSGDLRRTSLEAFSRDIGVQIDIPEYHRTNYGVLIHLPLYETGYKGICIAPLACQDGEGNTIALILQDRGGGNPRRFYVGMHGYSVPVAKPWHPYFRRIEIPPPTPIRTPNFLSPAVAGPSSPSDFSSADPIPYQLTHIWSHLTLTRMYIHSHNSDPQRSTRLGVERQQLLVHQPSRTRRLQRFVFELPPYTLRKLRDGAGMTILGWPNKPNNVRAGWTPMRNWHLADADQRLVLVFEPPDKRTNYRHGAVLFRGPDRAALVLVVGVTPRGVVWSEAVVRGAHEPTDGLDWNEDDHEIVKRLWDEARGPFTEPTKAERLRIDGNSWKDGRKVFGHTGRRARITFTPWYEQDEANTAMGDINDPVVMKWTIGVEVDFPGGKVWTSEEEKAKRLSGLSRIGASGIRT